MEDIVKLSIKELSGKLDKKELSSKEVVSAYFEVIDKKEKDVGAFLDIYKEESLKAAESFDSKNGKRKSVFDGVPVAIKDNMNITGKKTTCASKILENYTAPYNATVVEKLKNVGAIIVGKTNLDEFAMGSSCENSALKVTKNPRDLSTVPGGSSGGSAAVVAADMVPVSLGSDTGGSIRQPASFCGVVGFKPTYGRISRYGLVAFASSLDQIGPFGRTVEDAAYLYEIVSGRDSHDSTSADLDPDSVVSTLNDSIKGKTVGVIKELMGEGIDKDVQKELQDAIKVYEKLGANIKEVSLPSFKHALAAYYIIATAEASSNLARYDGVKYGFREKADELLDMYKETRDKGFGAEVKRRIILGTYVLSSGYYDAFYLKAQKVRNLIRQNYDEAFETCDVLLSVTSPTKAFKFGEKMADPLAMYLSDIATIPVNLGGNPAVSFPSKPIEKDLPVGIQLAGKLFDEKSILNFANVYERNLG
ncbi:Asp-tRNA(Asn)/Glu-tRNA(Gln) amidotransferase subunit GatA [Candidatus Margulisiibacteriota bacterium]